MRKSTQVVCAKVRLLQMIYGLLRLILGVELTSLPFPRLGVVHVAAHHVKVPRALVLNYHVLVASHVLSLLTPLPPYPNPKSTATNTRYA